MLGRHQQIDMPEHPAAGFVQDKVAQGLVGFNELALIPDGFTRRGRDAADNDVANFTRCMATLRVRDSVTA
ncbi:hypothetical protein D9M71_765390 [compost metagenome]